MNKYLLFTFIALVSFAFGNASQAEPRKRSSEQKERFFMAKVKMIQQELKLTEEQTNEFTPIYRKYNDEMSGIFDKTRAEEQKLLKAGNKNAQKVVNLRIDMKIEILEMQRRYTEKFAKVLTPEQLLRLEDAERKIQFQIMKRHNRRGERNNAKQRTDGDKSFAQ
ncbi:MAG: Spy/CpxP family protein refolding chaperone [Muribaculaceae bacterium]